LSSAKTKPLKENANIIATKIENIFFMLLPPP
jgi:hypothetical protein